MPAANRVCMTKQDKLETVDVEKLETITGGLFGGPGLFGGGGVFGLRSWRQQRLGVGAAASGGSSCAGGSCPGAQG